MSDTDIPITVIQAECGRYFCFNINISNEMFLNNNIEDLFQDETPPFEEFSIELEQVIAWRCDTAGYTSPVYLAGMGSDAFSFIDIKEGSVYLATLLSPNNEDARLHKHERKVLLKPKMLEYVRKIAGFIQ